MTTVLSSSVLMIPTMLAFTRASSVLFGFPTLTTQRFLLLQHPFLLYGVVIVAEEAIGALCVVTVGASTTLWTVTIRARSAVALWAVAIGA